MITGRTSPWPLEGAGLGPGCALRALTAKPCQPCVMTRTSKYLAGLAAVPAGVRPPAHESEQAQLWHAIEEGHSNSICGKPIHLLMHDQQWDEFGRVGTCPDCLEKAHGS